MCALAGGVFPSSELQPEEKSGYIIHSTSCRSFLGCSCFLSLPEESHSITTAADLYFLFFNQDILYTQLLVALFWGAPVFYLYQRSQIQLQQLQICTFFSSILVSSLFSIHLHFSRLSVYNKDMQSSYAVSWEIFAGWGPGLLTSNDLLSYKAMGQ